MTDSPNTSGIQVGEKPPEFELPQTGTGQLRTAADFAGLPTILYMWASW